MIKSIRLGFEQVIIMGARDDRRYYIMSLSELYDGVWHISIAFNIGQFITARANPFYFHGSYHAGINIRFQLDGVISFEDIAA